MLEFHWNGQRSAVRGDGVHFFFPKRLNLFSLSFSLSFSRLPGLDSLVIVTLAGRVWARLEAGVLCVVGDTSILSEEMADVMAWIHVFISSFKKPQRQRAITTRVPHTLLIHSVSRKGDGQKRGMKGNTVLNSSPGAPLWLHACRRCLLQGVSEEAPPPWCGQGSCWIYALYAL